MWLALSGALGVAVAAPTGPPQTGYWWLPEPVSGLIPVPGVPANGMYVASSPSGPQAESALRMSVVDQTAYVRVTLHVSMQERVGTPAVVGYPASSKWQTGGPQPWSGRPSYRASAKPAKGVFGPRHATMTITIPATEATTGVVLVPDPHAASGTFSVAFAPPSTADISVMPTPRPSAHPTHSQAPPSHRPTKRATPSSTATGRHTSASGRPSHSPAATKPPRTTSPSATPSGSAPPTQEGSAPARDVDHPARDVILISAVVVGAVVLLSWWRAARRR